MKRVISLFAILFLFSSYSFCQTKEAISLKRINAAKTEYYDKEIEIYGNLELSDYYNWGYSKSEDTHYSFKLRDNDNNRVQVYFKKTISKQLFDQLIDVDNLPVKIKVIAYRSKQEGNFGDILLEGISFELASSDANGLNSKKNDKYTSSTQSKASELISKQPISLKRVNAAKTEYYDKEIEIYGNLELSDYYNWGYRKSEDTHYSFKLRDNDNNRVQVYFKKTISQQLFDQLIDVDNLPVKIKVIAYQSKQEGNFGDILLEGIRFELIR
jgi:hypothetical protein